jgi:hypothetical protein
VVQGLLSLQVSTPATQPTEALQTAGVQRSGVTKLSHDITVFKQVALTSAIVNTQESSVHKLLSSQLTGCVSHKPVSLWQVWGLHKSELSHSTGMNWQPAVPLVTAQLSTVQLFPSSHTIGEPEQTPLVLSQE